MKIWVIYKIRKDQDMYQAHSWRLVSGGNVEDEVKAEMDSLIKRLSSGEIRAGWTYEMGVVEANVRTESKVQV
jgi:hypothetical protein